MIDSTANQSNHPASLFGGNEDQPHSIVHVAADSHSKNLSSSLGYSPSYAAGGGGVSLVSGADQSGFRYISVSTHTRRLSDSGHQPAFLGQRQPAASLCSVDNAGQHQQVIEDSRQSPDLAQILHAPADSLAALKESRELGEVSRLHDTESIDHRYCEDDPPPVSTYSQSQLAVPPLSSEREDAATRGRRRKASSVLSPTRSPSPVVSTSFASPPFIPELVAPLKLDSPRSEGVGTGHENDQLVTRITGSDLDTSPLPTASRTSTRKKHVTRQRGAQSEQSKLQNDEAKSSSRRKSSSSNPARSSREGSRKGISKTSNKIHPSRRK